MCYLKMNSVENNCIVQVEYGLCNGANKTWDVQIHVQALFNKQSNHRQGQTTANGYRRGKTKSNPRASIGLQSANNIQQGKAER